MKILPHYSAILLDLDDTLLDFGKSEEQALKIAFLQAGLNFFPEVVSHYQRINRSLWQQHERGSLTKEKVFKGRWEILFRQYGISHDSEAASSLYLNQLAHNPIWLAGAEDFLATIAKIYRIVIVTNADGKTARKRMELTGITEIASGIVISEEVGAAKPHKQIFAYAMAAAEADSKSEILMIGDNYETDILGAENFGIDSCWYNPSKKKCRTARTPRYESSNHQEIATWLSQ